MSDLCCCKLDVRLIISSPVDIVYMSYCWHIRVLSLCVSFKCHLLQVELLIELDLNCILGNHLFPNFCSCRVSAASSAWDCESRSQRIDSRGEWPTLSMIIDIRLYICDENNQLPNTNGIITSCWQQLSQIICNIQMALIKFD